MQLTEAVRLALQAAWSHKLRSFFTLLGIIVSVAFLVAVVAVIQGMNAYVRENLTGAIVGVNAFQVRRTPIQIGFVDDEELRTIQRRPIIAPEVTVEDVQKVTEPKLKVRQPLKVIS